MELAIEEKAQELIYSALRMLGHKIEACGASPELTDAVSLCSDLSSAIGNKYNLPNKCALQRVLDKIDDLA